eukprot:TRINITY_DN11525_c0_g1_i1.p1 TRINITY_DN11525_c0_g1~~TRINITY_DN11525_c0_g1_i1.p1  ORF type:complete len:218 (+),score=26.18 TRINITY_DN11525_c0_g1_i1:32-685(+)
MPLFTIISRVSDRLMLAESLDTDEDRSQDLDFYKKQAKQLLQTLGATSEPTGIITTGNNYFLYLIENGVCYLTLCDATFPKKLAYSFLEELKKEFDIQHGADVNTAKRPYSHQKFDTFIQKTKKLYMDTKSQRNLNKVSSDLKDINRIMTKNIQDIVNRGAKLDEIGNRAEQLTMKTDKYKKHTVDLNRMYFWRTYGPIMGGVGIILLLIILRFWFF